jgi:hypothetical protein
LQFVLRLAYFLLAIKYVEILHSVIAFAPLILLIGLLITKILSKRLRICAAILYAVFGNLAVAQRNLSKTGNASRLSAFGKFRPSELHCFRHEGFLFRESGF